MRAVIDTNVLISGMISNKGAPAVVVDAWIEKRFTPVVSKAIIEEYFEVVTRDKFNGIGSVEERINFIKLLLYSAEVVVPQKRFEVIKADSADDKFIECAVEGSAKRIVAGDAHLLHVGTFIDIEIVTPRFFIEELSQR